MRRSRIVVIAGVVTVAALLGATEGAEAGGRQVGADFAAATTDSPLRKPRRRVLRGTKRVTRFVVPRGQTALVAGTLRIVAKKEIAISGTLVVSPGARLSLRAGRKLTIARGASITPTAARREAAALALDRRPSAAGRAQALGPILLQGYDVLVAGDVVAAPSQSVQVLANADGSVTLAGSIVTKPGQGSIDPVMPGGDSGSIVVTGGVFGKARTISLGKRAILRTGDGGEGYDDFRGTLRGVLNPCNDSGVDPPGGADRQVLFLEGTDGGDAGSIRLLAKNYDLRGRITLGNGGLGGHAGFSRFQPERTRAPNGTAGHGGGDVFARSGNGGRGGSFETEDGDGAARAGAGGDAGSIRVAAGNGAENCDGGRTDVRLGLPGQRGKRGAAPRTTARGGVIELSEGGNGGSSSDRNHVGGNGGPVRLDQSGEPREPAELAIYGRGGVGYFGCSGAQIVNGTDGGNGGSIRAGRTPYTAFRSFDGRDGGDGVPHGKGGKAGAFDSAPASSDQSFLNGPDGKLCPNALFRYDASNLQVGWINPYSGAPVTGTYSLAFCGANAFAQNWTYSGTLTDHPAAFSGFFRFDVDPFMPMETYNDSNGNPLASVGVRFILSGQQPSLVLAPVAVATGSTSIRNPGPQTVELLGRVVQACS